MSRAACVASEWRDRLSAAGLADLALLLDGPPDRAPLAGRWEPLTKPGLVGRERWRWELSGDPGDPGDAVLFLKRYVSTPLRAQWDRILRQDSAHSRAHWEFIQSQRLREACVGAPRPVGYVERMRGRIERGSAVLLERVAGDSLDRVWAAAQPLGAPITRGLGRRDLVVRLARFVAAFHGTGLCHRDLYLCHVFAEIAPDGGAPPRFAIVDLARAHRPRWRRMRWLLKDLSQLDASARQIGASRADRCRFLLAYLGLQRGASRARWYARCVVRRSDRILRREQRKSRSA